MKEQPLHFAANELRQMSEYKKLSILASILPSLSKAQSICIHLRYWECLSIQEISKRLRVPWEKVDSLIEESLCRLRAKFKESSPLWS